MADIAADTHGRVAHAEVEGHGADDGLDAGVQVVFHLRAVAEIDVRDPGAGVTDLGDGHVSAGEAFGLVVGVADAAEGIVRGRADVEDQAQRAVFSMRHAGEGEHGRGGGEREFESVH